MDPKIPLDSVENQISKDIITLRPLPSWLLLNTTYLSMYSDTTQAPHPIGVRVSDFSLFSI